MGKKNLGSWYGLAISVGVFAMSGSAIAQHPGPYFWFDGGVSFVQDLNTMVADTSGKLQFDPGARVTLGVGYMLYSSPSIESSVQFETGVIYNSLKRLREPDFDPELTSHIEGDYYQVPLLADIIYTFNLGPRLAPYIGVGGGGVWSRLDVKNIDGFEVDSTDDSFDPAVQGIAGLRIRLDPRTEIGFGYKFLAAFGRDVNYIGTHSLSLTCMVRF